MPPPAYFNTTTLETNETNNGLPGTQDSEAINALRQKRALNMLKLLELDEAIRKIKDALHQAQSEIEATKKAAASCDRSTN